MGFIDETKKLLGINNSLQNYTSCNVAPKHGIIVEGYKKIKELSKAKIVVLCEDQLTLEIVGTNLIIKEIANKELSINGTIKTLTFN